MFLLCGIRELKMLLNNLFVLDLDCYGNSVKAWSLFGSITLCNYSDTPGYGMAFQKKWQLKDILCSRLSMAML